MPPSFSFLIPLVLLPILVLTPKLSCSWSLSCLRVRPSPLTSLISGRDAGQALPPLTSLNPYRALLIVPQALGPTPMCVVLSGREGLGQKSETVWNEFSHPMPLPPEDHSFMSHICNCSHARPMLYQGGQVTTLALWELRVLQRTWTRSYTWAREHKWSERNGSRFCRARGGHDGGYCCHSREMSVAWIESDTFRVKRSPKSCSRPVGR